MRFRSLLALITAVALAGFFVLNWQFFTTPAKLNLLVSSIDAPLGAVMLVLFALVIVVLTSYVSAWQGTLLSEFRRQSKELQAQRKLTEIAEESRFTELGALIRAEIAGSDQRVAAALEAFRRDLTATENSIAATLGEMDDRYQRSAERRAG
jgi:uncharacterized membrane protein